VSGRRSDALRGAAAARSVGVQQRASQALKALDRRGERISFQAVAAEAGVSRAFLYAHPQLRAAIEQHRNRQKRVPSRLPAGERASDESIRVRLRGMLEENKRLRSENAQLRKELALAHGRVRELELTCRAGKT